MDARAALAREAHRLAGEVVRAADEQAAIHREQRDSMIRALRAEDPDRWTYPELARAVNCSPELIAAIVKGRTGKRSGPAT